MPKSNAKAKTSQKAISSSTKAPMRVTLDKASQQAAQQLTGKVIARAVAGDIKLLRKFAFSESKG